MIPVHASDAKEGLDDESEHKHAPDEYVDHEQVEVPVVVVPDAGEHPGAVVVVVQDASPGYAAVMCARGLDGATLSR